jgi:CRP/FNR family transcriptional regulator, anaerobic regulatory protein
MTTIESLERYATLSERSRNLILENTVLIEVPQNTQLIAVGDVCRDAYFVEKGVARVYYKEERNDELISVTSWFAQEGGLLSSINSFLTQKPSDEYIQILEDCTLRILPRTVLEQMWKESPEISQAFLRLYEHYLIVYERRIHHLIRQRDPLERYLFFLKIYPTLLNRVPHKYIASYLEMRPETLSRVRREMMERKLL